MIHQLQCMPYIYRPAYDQTSEACLLSADWSEFYFSWTSTERKPLRMFSECRLWSACSFTQSDQILCRPQKVHTVFRLRVFLREKATLADKHTENDCQWLQCHSIGVHISMRRSMYVREPDKIKNFVILAIFKGLGKLEYLWFTLRPPASDEAWLASHAQRGARDMSCEDLVVKRF